MGRVPTRLRKPSHIIFPDRRVASDPRADVQSNARLGTRFGCVNAICCAITPPIEWPNDVGGVESGRVHDLDRIGGHLFDGGRGAGDRTLADTAIVER
jgi:hypothetical protein